MGPGAGRRPPRVRGCHTFPRKGRACSSSAKISGLPLGSGRHGRASLCLLEAPYLMAELQASPPSRCSHSYKASKSQVTRGEDVPGAGPSRRSR